MPIYKKGIKPKYIRIYNWVHSKVRKGQLNVGEQIPTEPELARQFFCSRMTVRKAIDPLVLEGVLERRPGLGTFVVSTGIMKLTFDASKPMLFSQQMTIKNIHHQTDYIERNVVTADQSIRTFLNLKKEKQVICLTGVGYIDKEPAYVERSYLPYNKYKALCDMEINVPLSKLLAEEFDTPIKQVTQYISAVVAGKREMELLKINFPIPCIYLEWISHQENGSPFSVSVCHLRSDVYKFKMPMSDLLHVDKV